MVGFKNGHIRKYLTQNGEPQRHSWETQKKKKTLVVVVMVVAIVLVMAVMSALTWWIRRLTNVNRHI